MLFPNVYIMFHSEVIAIKVAVKLQSRQKHWKYVVFGPQLLGEIDPKVWTCIFKSGFYRASICEGGLGSRNSVRLSVCLSVCPSVTRVHCDKTKWRTADIFIPHERAITLLLWHQEWLVGDAPFPQKSAFKVTHPIRKTPSSTDFRSYRLNHRRQQKKFNYDEYKVDHGLSNEP